MGNDHPAKRSAQDATPTNADEESLCRPSKQQKTATSPAEEPHDPVNDSPSSTGADAIDREQIAGLESRIDFLEDLLLQLRRERQGCHDTSNPHHPFTSSASLRDVQDKGSAVPSDLPDWASRARRDAKAKTRRRLPRPRKGDDSHEMLEMTVRNLEKSAHHEQLSLPHEDDDLLIRGLRDGWDVVARTHKLDTVWRFLRMFELYVYQPMDAISRLAALRALRTMLVHRIQPANQALRSVPAFFEPTRLQKAERHSSLIDYFAWPSVRDHLIKHNRDIRSIPRIAQTKFAGAFVFDWPYELSDAFMTIKASGRLVFSEDFNRRWNDLRYWTITAFDDTSFIPAHLQLDRKQLTQCVEVVSAAEWGHIAEGVRSARYFMGDMASASGRVVGLLELDTDEAAQESLRQAEEDTANVQPGQCPARASESRQPLDEWSWFFKDPDETHNTIQSLLHMEIPA